MGTIIASVCENGRICPTIIDEGNNVIAVQGYIHHEDDFTPPGGEAVVTIPKSILLEAARKLTQT